MESLSILEGADLWLAVLCGLGLLLVGLSLGHFISYYLKKASHRRIEAEAEERVTRRLGEEERLQRIAFLEEKDGWYRVRGEQEKELEAKHVEQSRREKDLVERDREFDNQRGELRREWGRLKNQERRLNSRERTIRDTEVEVEQVKSDYRERLELVAELTEEEAKEHLLEQLSDSVRARAAEMIRAARIRAREEAEVEARKIVAQAIQRCGVSEAEHIVTSAVTLPSESLKSRIIGKEGRNVRAFESTTSVKVIVDDTPDTVLLSSYDPLKREVAVRAMSQLIRDRGFTPNRIEEVVKESRSSLERDMEEAGRNALIEIDATDFHPDLPRSVGMLKYRSSYGQNQLQHCLEVAHLSGLMAAEIGLDTRLTKRAGLLHDIGKTVSREQEGSHIDLGQELADRYGEHPVVREVIAEHHEDHERLDPICFLVKTADAISSTRPGGRREDLEGYARRIMKLEEIANSFAGVKDVFAINAGREIRVMVQGDRVSDDDAEILAFDIADRVKNELTFAGEVKVMVMRETRAVRYTGQRPRGQRNGRSRDRRNGHAARRRNGHSNHSEN
ncbi:MAG: ribonuclease Y [Candidatus Latescibacterota bacterium]|nr:ribonuclease Y [Candidatus Latescibacterota bacterium]